LDDELSRLRSRLEVLERGHAEALQALREDIDRLEVRHSESAPSSTPPPMPLPRRSAALPAEAAELEEWRRVLPAEPLSGNLPAKVAAMLAAREKSRVAAEAAEAAEMAAVAGENTAGGCGAR
jgi:hypothetical protein